MKVKGLEEAEPEDVGELFATLKAWPPQAPAIPSATEWPKVLVRMDGKEVPMELGDTIIPKTKGFLSDFVLSKKGSEVASLFTLFSGFWLLSTATTRQVHLNWEQDPMYPNLYIILVCPPNMGHKGTALNHATKTRAELLSLLKESGNLWEHFFQDGRTLRSKATPESLGIIMKHRKKTFMYEVDNATHEVKCNTGSQLPMVIDELTTFLSKSQYATTLTDKLTDLYDSKDEDGDLTRARGFEKFEDIFATFIGGTTPTHLQSSLPPEAFGGGFMSRTMLIYQGDGFKCFSLPDVIKGAPDRKELAKRLAWCIHNAKFKRDENGDWVQDGSFYFTPEAYAFYDAWYIDWHKKCVASMHSNEMTSNRTYVHLVKLALLIRMQEYREGHDISEQNMRDAATIVEYIQRTSHLALQMVNNSESVQNLQYLRKVLYTIRMQRGTAGVSRRSLLQKVSRHFTASELNEYLAHLAGEGTIEIWDKHGAEAEYPSTSQNELYVMTDMGVDFYERNETI